ncbi:hypothetical protein Tco_1533008 [Tanacetum coccineum]
MCLESGFLDAKFDFQVVETASQEMAKAVKVIKRQDVGFVELFKEYEIGDVSEEEIEVEKVEEVKELDVEYFDKFPTRDELAYHKYLLRDPSPPFFRICPTIVGGNPLNLKIPCNIGHILVWKAYIDLNPPVNIMSRNFTYITDFVIVEDVNSIIDPCLSHVVLGKPFVKESNMTYDPSLGIIKFTTRVDESFYRRIEEKLFIIYDESLELKDLLKKANTKFLNDKYVLRVYDKFGGVFKETILLEENQVHVNYFQAGDGGDNSDDGGNNNDGSENIDGGEKVVGGENVDGGEKDVGGENVDGSEEDVDGENVDPRNEKQTIKVEYTIEACQNEDEEEIFEVELLRSGLKQISIRSERRLFENYLSPRVVQPVNMESPRTPERVVTHSSPKKRVVKPSSYMSSPYMNHKTKVIALLKRLEFVLSNSLFSMQGDKFETVFQTHSSDHETAFCLIETSAKIEGRIDDEEKWNVFSVEISAQFKNDVASMSLALVPLEI